MPKIAVIAKPGKFDDLIAMAERLVHETESEAGTEVHAMNVTGDDENAIWFYEVFTDEDAHRAHATTDAMARFASSLQELAEPDFEINELTPLAAKGLAPTVDV